MPSHGEYRRTRRVILEIDDELAEAKVVIEEWRNTYNHQSSHSGLGWKTPAAYAADWRM